MLAAQGTPPKGPAESHCMQCCKLFLRAFELISEARARIKAGTTGRGPREGPPKTEPQTGSVALNSET